MNQKVRLLLDGAVIATAAYGLAFDSAGGRQFVWVVVLLTAVLAMLKDLK